MATKSYEELKRQIQALSEEAEKLRSAEKGGVIARMKEAIEAYGITVKDLFGARASASKTPRGKPSSRAATKDGRAAAFADGKGGVWGGRGPRPTWLRQAIASGKKLEDFAVGANGAAPAAQPEPETAAAPRKAPAKKRAAKAKRPGNPKYKDAAGNTWNGRGLQPKWLKDALASGKTLDELRG